MIEIEYGYETVIHEIRAEANLKPVRVEVQLIQHITTTIFENGESTEFTDSLVVQSWTYPTVGQNDRIT